MTKPDRPVIKIYKAEAFLVPAKNLSNQEIQKAHRQFTYRFYADAQCKKCENVTSRHNDICDSCSAFKGARQTSKIIEKGALKKPYLSFPIGASKAVKKWLTSIGQDQNYELVDRHPDAEDFSRPIKFIKKPYDYQNEAIATLHKKKRGILESPPRTGKTVMGTKFICDIGKKAIVLGAQKEWLSQFRDTFLGSDTQVGFTNAKPRQVRVCQNLEDIEKADVALCTFSMFMSKRGQEMLEKIREKFAVLIVDECHGTPALQTSRILSRFNVEYMIGLSGTVERKQTEEIQIAHDLIGPIIHRCEVERLRAKLVTFFPKVKLKDPKGMSQAGMVYFQTQLESNSTRRKVLIKEIIKYAKAGHLVLVPLSRVHSILKWTQEINAETERPGFALPFYGGLKGNMRKEVVEKAKKYQCRVLVGNISLLSTGLNIPRASCIFEIGMTSNVPKATQRMARILTPMDDKPEPLIVYVLDDSELIRKCRRNEFWNCVKPRFDPVIHKEDEKALMSYLAGRVQEQQYDLKEGM